MAVLPYRGIRHTVAILRNTEEKVVMDDPLSTVSVKVHAIFSELVGDRARRLDGSVLASETMDAIGDALTESYGALKSHEIGFHMADWNSDAAFIVALHLFPERFTSQEIEAGIGLFLVHAPNHIRQACGLTNHFVWDDWPEDEPGLERGANGV